MARNRKRLRDRRLPGDSTALAMARGVEHPELGDKPVDPQTALGRPELANGAGDEDDGVNAAFEASGGELARPVAQPPAVRESLAVRLIGFLRGSWRELQRVQWPDRRQVFQATGVVIGFVIVAGVFLGLADLGSSRLVNLLLK